MILAKGSPQCFEDAVEQQWPQWSPDGSILAFGQRRIDRQGGRGHQLWLYHTESNDLSQVTQDSAYNNLIYVWAPSGQQIVFRRFNLDVNYPQSELWVYDLDNETLSLVAENATNGQWLP